ncbi:MAG: NAD(P)-dependent oxidoreductase [Elainella sp.]
MTGKVGLIGTGLMGAPMAERLLAHQPLVVYNRTPAKLAPLQQAGAELASSVAELLQCEVVILMLSDAAAIRATVLPDSPSDSPSDSLPEATDLSNCTLIQMGTIGPSQSRELLAEVTARGGEYLEAPVLGSIPEAKAGKLQVMVGATPAQYERWLPLLSQLGEPTLIGEVGAAAALKLALNQLIGSLTSAFGLSLRFTQQQGVPVEAFMQILRQSALYAPTFDKKLQRMVEQNYANPNFPTKHLLKDTRLFLDEAAGLETAPLAGVQQILEKACELGWADADYSALIAAIQPVEQ